MAVYENDAELDYENYSKFCDRIMKRYVDQFASVFIMFALSKAAREPLSFGDLYTEELDEYIDFEDTMPLWEEGDIEALGEIFVEGIYNYCVDVSGKFPTHSKIHYRQRWATNIETGLKSVGLRV